MPEHHPSYLHNYNNNEIKCNFVEDCENFKFPILQEYYSHDPLLCDDETQIGDAVTSTNRRR